MKIGDFTIGSRTFIIAEIGNNHLGDPELAEKSLRAAAKTGVDAVKFQLFDPKLLVSRDEPVLAHVLDKVNKTQRERFSSMVLSHDVFTELAELAKKLGIYFMATPFDEKSVDFLDELVPAFKIASGDANNRPLISKIISKEKPIFISTGLCDQEEVDEIYASLPKDRSVLLHCIGSYPTPDDQASLFTIPFYRKRYDIQVGYSDHTQGEVASIAACALGAVVIEKHFILDKSIPGGDREVSLVPEEMSIMVNKIKRLDKMKGDLERRIMDCEQKMKVTLRRSAYAYRDFKKGEEITYKDVVWLRPVVSSGLSYADFSSKNRFFAKQEILNETPLTRENVNIEKQN